LSDFGVTTMPNNCSFVGVQMRDGKREEVEKVEFVWEFPQIEEDI